MSEHLNQAQLKGYQNRLLSAEELVAADRHLAGCSLCSNELAALAEAIDSQSVITGVHVARFQHLSYEQMEDWVEDRLDQSGRELVMAHIGNCAPCARQLMAYQEYAPVMAAPIQTKRVKAAQLESASLATKLWEFFKQPHIALAAAGLVALFVVAPWNSRVGVQDITTGMTRVDSTTQQVPARQGGQMANLAATAAEFGDLPDSIRAGATEIAANPTQAARPESLAGLPEKPDGSIEFPASEVVESTHPELRWTAFGGTYNVSLYDASHRLVARQGSMESQWTLPSALVRGETYWFEIESGGQRHRGSFRVLSDQQYSDLEKARSTHSGSHLVLGAVYEQLGLLTPARAEFEAVAKDKPQQGGQLLNHLAALRQ